VRGAGRRGKGEHEKRRKTPFFPKGETVGGKKSSTAVSHTLQKTSTPRCFPKRGRTPVFEGGELAAPTEKIIAKEGRRGRKVKF